MNLLYYLIGKKEQLYNQCYFSIFSFLQFNEIDNIYIYTDMPSSFQKLKDKVTLIQVTNEQKQEWPGSANDMWRMKLKVIEHLALQTDDLFLYADTDTFLYRPLTPVIEGLKQGKAYMHVRDSLLKDMRYSPHRMWKQTRNKTFGSVLFTDDLYMWNAGVIALPPEKRLETVRLALSINDGMRDAGVDCIWTEQYSVSIAVEKIYGINGTSEMIGHYWGNKPEWDIAINNFLMRQYYEDNTLPESINQLKQMDLLALPYFKHASSTKRRLNKLLDRLFPDKNAKFLK